jgi:N6-adenosine-specific RNA methylase IME4
MNAGLPTSERRELLKLENSVQSPVEFSTIRAALDTASTPEEIIDIEAKIEAVEVYLRRSGLAKNLEEMWPVREAKLEARWKLGRVLAEIERRPGPGRGKKDVSEGNTFSALLDRLGLDRKAAMLAQRIGTLPEEELFAAFADARAREIILDYVELICRARPYWYQESRAQKHQAIREEAVMTETSIGPFPLIYADPPWQFEVYSEKGLDRTPDQHYPTLSDDEIINFRVAGKTVPEIATHDAVLLLWCTSSNIMRAFAVMKAWDFTFKTQAIWVKDKTGLGLVFRNQHEHLLYGTRGDMPGPLWQPPSVFSYPRGRHSAKPPEIRQAIEKMYPAFGEGARLELFARGDNPGSVNYGFEVYDADASGRMKACASEIPL